MTKGKKQNWNKNGKNRKTRQTEQERQIAELLDQTDEQDLLQISAIHSAVSMPLPNQERLAWDVIDRADLADEEEMERRRVFNRMLRRKKIMRGLIGSGIVAVLLVVLALCGVFDRFDPPAYETYYIASGVSFQGEEPESTLPEDVEWGIPSLAQEPDVDLDKLDTTVYHALAEYCSANDYAVGEYRIQNQDYVEYVVIDGDLYLECDVLAECMDYKKKAGNQTWKDLGYLDVVMDKNSGDLYQRRYAADLGVAMPEDVRGVWTSDSYDSYKDLISIDENLAINTYLTYMTVYIKI
ncbi:MAG: hypothetical protein K2J67_05535 [Lachnospiraceae bacterium]|nr:hypothetical protein [Lachnospiraceae bacterium]